MGHLRCTLAAPARTLLDLFRESVTRSPVARALDRGAESLTDAEFADAAAVVAFTLVGIGAGRRGRPRRTIILVDAVATRSTPQALPAANRAGCQPSVWRSPQRRRRCSVDTRGQGNPGGVAHSEEIAQGPLPSGVDA